MRKNLLHAVCFARECGVSGAIVGARPALSQERLSSLPDGAWRFV